MSQPGSKTYHISWVQQIAEVSQHEWDALAQPLAVPFLEWEWLRLMEASGSTSPEKGWLPIHLTVRRGNRLAAAAPLYIKGHSAGEFVFDHAWADVAERLGIAYYPKLVGMSPFTPAEGYRFLIAPGEDSERLTAIMVHAIERFCVAQRLSGVSFNYIDPEWRLQMEKFGFRAWMHQSFSWRNRGYRSFDDFLARFKSNQRRNIRRERKAMERQGFELDVFQGDRIPREFLDHMYRLYARTNDRFGIWGCKYLTPEFFGSLFRGYRHRLLFVAAFNGERRGLPTAMSMFLTKADRLYGRYWGALREADALHFNACYYQPIEWAIGHGIRLFDPGIGGPHKVRRGFEAVANYSLHRFFDPRLQQVMDRYLHGINRNEQVEIEEINAEIPFAKRDDGMPPS
ncbi:MAG: GNAT family N-acetyltransferase [Desulfobacterales bacterium]